MTEILVVDGDAPTRRLVRAACKREGLSVCEAGSLTAARRRLHEQTFGVVIVSLTLPDGSGLDVLGDVDLDRSSSHVIVLSGSSTESDRLRGFEAGADDYVTKPFYASELVARILAVRRRRITEQRTDLEIGALHLNVVARTAKIDGTSLHLTTKEFDLLAFLAARPSVVFTRDELLRLVWGSSSDWQQASTVTEHIRRLRAKIELDPHHPCLISTVRGTGYRFDPPGAREAADLGQGFLYRQPTVATATSHDGIAPVRPEEISAAVSDARCPPPDPAKPGARSEASSVATLTRAPPGTSSVGPDAHVGAAPASATRSVAFDCLGANVAVLDGSGGIVDTNEAWRLFARLNDGPPGQTGLGANYLATCDRSAAGGDPIAAAVAAGVRGVLTGERTRFDIEYPCPSPAEDRWFLLEASASPVVDGAGAVLLHMDITSRRVLADGLAAEANQDALTGLPNRRNALAHLAELLGEGVEVGVIFLDLDGFKRVNDRYGHHAGDELLVKAASRIQRAVGDDGFVARLGGDEFLVIGSGVGWDDEGAHGVAEAIRDVIVRPFQDGAQTVSLGVSFGIATSDEQETRDGALIVRAADARMYVDKERGRDRRRHRAEIAKRLPTPSASVGAQPKTVPGVAPEAVVVAELQRSEARFEAVMAHSSDLVIFFDAEGAIDWVSPSVLDRFGVDAASLVGRNGFEIIHPDDQERVINDFVSIPNQGDHVRSEFRVVLGGRVRWVEEIATNLLDEPNVRCVVGNLRDITERKEAADALSFQGTLLAAAGQAIIARDDDDRVLYWNDAAESLYGWSSGEAMGRPLNELIPLADVTLRAVGAGRADASRSQPWDGEMCVVTRSGREASILVTSRPVFDDAGHQVATTVVSLDISEQRLAEEAAARLSAIVESSNDAIFSADPDGTITTWNEGAARLYGRSAQDTIGRPVTVLVVAEDGDALARCFDDAKIDGHSESLLAVGAGVDDHRFDVAISMSPIRTAAGALIGVSTIARDVTDDIRRQQRTEQARQRLADAQASARLGSFEVDLTTGGVVRSPELCRILGIEPDTVMGVDFGHIHVDDRSEVRRAFGAAAAGDPDVSCTHRIVRPDGVIRWVISRTSPQMASDPAVLTGTMLDITEQHEAELALAHLANHDPLTGLANRRLLVEELDRSLCHNTPDGTSTGLMYIDLDDFKAINDRFGHIGGDEILRAVGALIAGTVEPGDTVARLGGDEFLVCCDTVASAEDLMGRATRIQAILDEPLPALTDRIRISASIGVARSVPGFGSADLLRNADAAMYAAKEAGGGRSALFDDSLHAEVKRRQRLTADIEPALHDGQIVAHFQPVVELSTGMLTGFEALARWDHPDLGVVPPLEFVDLAERSGAIGGLGRRVLADACAALSTWRERMPGRRLSVAVNVSPLQLADQTFPVDVRRAIATAGIPPECVCLEVTESALMDSDLAVEALRRLKAIGVTIAIDDFGTGYSSLSRLRRFPVDLLKIDRSFVTGIGSDPEDQAIVATVIDLARSLAIDVIAEGIETQTQLDLLAQLGCGRGQGYLWSAALPLAEATAFASSQGSLLQTRANPAPPLASATSPRA